MAQQVRTLAALPENMSSVPTPTLGDLQMLTPILGDWCTWSLGTLALMCTHPHADTQPTHN